MNRYFGEPWDASFIDDAVQVPTPVGETCVTCQEPIIDGEQGVITPYLHADVNGAPAYGGAAYHRGCFLLGVLGHMVGTCFCFPDKGTTRERGQVTVEWADNARKRESDECDALLEQSSLGAANAQAVQALTPEKVIDAIQGRETVPDMVCVTCLRPVHRLTLKGVAQWTHGFGRDDHEIAVAPRAEMAEVRNQCDFCCSDKEPAVWCYLTREEVGVVLADPTVTDRVERKQFSGDRETGGWTNVKPIPGKSVDRAHVTSSKGWAACELCAMLIELRDVNRLATRARRVGSPVMQAKPHAYFREVWSGFFADISHRVPISKDGQVR